MPTLTIYNPHLNAVTSACLSKLNIGKKSLEEKSIYVSDRGDKGFKVNTCSDWLISAANHNMQKERAVYIMANAMESAGVDPKIIKYYRNKKALTVAEHKECMAEINASPQTASDRMIRQTRQLSDDDTINGSNVKKHIFGKKALDSIVSTLVDEPLLSTNSIIFNAVNEQTFSTSYDDFDLESHIRPAELKSKFAVELLTSSNNAHNDNEAILNLRSFHRYAKSEFSSENSLFLLAAHICTVNPSDDNMRYIYETFIDDKANLSVNIDSRTRKNFTIYYNKYLKGSACPRRFVDAVPVGSVDFSCPRRLSP